MTESDHYLLAAYEPVSVIDGNPDVVIVRHRISGRLYIKKVLSIYDARVFRSLMKEPVTGIPSIEAVVEDGARLIVIEEYVSGQTIRSRLDEGILFSEYETAVILRDLCTVLQKLHTRKPEIVHRDIKPSNVLILPDGHAMLLDLNAATLYSEGKSRDTELIGTYGYAAPEQYGFGASGTGADIYALGVLMNEMLTGAQPYQKLASGRFNRIIRKCIMMDPKDRYDSPISLRRDLPRIPDESEGRLAPYLPWLPPGFRSLDPSHIILALMGYFLIINFGLTSTFANRTLQEIWLERILGVVAALLIVLITCNYLNIWERIGIDRIHNRFLKILMISVLDFAVVFLLFAGLYLLF